MNLIEILNEEIEQMNPVSVKTKKKRGRPAKVSNDIFIEMWNNALKEGSLAEIAQAIGSSPASCAVKASNLRKAGYNLPQFKRGRPKKNQ